MSRNKLIIILFSSLGVLLLLYFTFRNGSFDTPHVWTENYQADSKEPYGTLFIKEMLAEYRTDESFIYNTKEPLANLLDSVRQQGQADYVFVGHEIYLSDADIDALLSYLHEGHDALIACNNLPLEIIDSISQYSCDREIYGMYDDDSLAVANFYHHTLHTDAGYAYTYFNGLKESSYPWGYITPEVFCEETRSIVPLGNLEPDRVNFAQFKYGTGHLYVHTNPIMFTNYYLVDEAKVAYADAVFSHLRGNAIIWDELSKAPFSGEGPRHSPLSFILQHPSLKYAWWMMLAAALLYTIFAAKRKQRIIPVLEEKTNTSLEYVKTVAALHYQNGNHLNITRKKMKYFLHFVKTKYGLYAPEFTEGHMKRLAEKSGIDLKDIQFIFSRYRHALQDTDPSETQQGLISMYYAIDHFYKHCK